MKKEVPARTVDKLIEMITNINSKINEIKDCITRIERESATQAVRIDKLEEFEKEYRDLNTKIFFTMISAIVSIIISIISILLQR